LPDVEYDSHDKVIKVRKSGQIRFANREIFVGEGLLGELVAVRPAGEDGVFKVYFCDREIRTLDLRKEP
jgi:hypothetical protein